MTTKEIEQLIEKVEIGFVVFVLGLIFILSAGVVFLSSPIASLIACGSGYALYKLNALGLVAE